jgi:hypothetical protein
VKKNSFGLLELEMADLSIFIKNDLCPLEFKVFGTICGLLKNKLIHHFPNLSHSSDDL